MKFTTRTIALLVLLTVGMIGMIGCESSSPTALPNSSAAPPGDYETTVSSVSADAAYGIDIGALHNRCMTDLWVYRPRTTEETLSKDIANWFFRNVEDSETKDIHRAISAYEQNKHMTDKEIDNLIVQITTTTRDQEYARQIMQAILSDTDREVLHSQLVDIRFELESLPLGPNEPVALMLISVGIASQEWNCGDSSLDSWGDLGRADARGALIGFAATWTAHGAAAGACVGSLAYCIGQLF